MYYDWPLILAYHSVSEQRQDGLTVRVGDFQWQMAWLHGHGYRSLTLAEFVREVPKKGERIVIITFDDGYADNYTRAFPILQRFGFVATIFLVSDYVNTDHIHWWDAAKIRTPRDSDLYRILTWEQVHEMAAYGFEFGSHTCTHPRLTDLSPEESWLEIRRSRTELQAKLGSEVLSFCYPHGSVSPAVVKLVEKADYRGAVVSPRRAGIPISRYTLRRVGIYRHNAPWFFRLKITPLARRYYGRFGMVRRALFWGYKHLVNLTRGLRPSGR